MQILQLYPIEILRMLFISYQSQFYNDNCMYSMIGQSDQQRSIKAGNYDEYILNNFEIKNGALKLSQKHWDDIILNKTPIK